MEAFGFVEAIRHSAEVDVLWVGIDLHEQAMHLLTERRDKWWSLCDAVSFEVMRERDVRAALTTDHNFEQAGFVRLLAQ